jgi:hypothetical protein
MVNPPTQSVAIDGSAPVTAFPTDLTPWLIGAAVAGGVAVVGGAGWYLWRRSAVREQPHKARRARRSQPAGRRVSAGEAPAPGPGLAAGPRRFCTQCGQAVLPEDRFCRHCGAELRNGE